MLAAGGPSLTGFGVAGLLGPSLVSFVGVDSLIAEAIKALLELHHNERGGSTLESVGKREARNNAIRKHILLDIENRTNRPQSATLTAQRIPVPDVEKPGYTLPGARVLAGRLGFDNRIADAKRAEAQRASDEGRLWVTIDGKAVQLRIMASGVKGEITYWAQLTRDTVTFVHWIFRYSLWFTVQRVDNGQIVTVEIPLFSTSGTWGEAVFPPRQHGRRGR